MTTSKSPKTQAPTRKHRRSKHVDQADRSTRRANIRAYLKKKSGGPHSPAGSLTMKSLLSSLPAPLPPATHSIPVKQSRRTTARQTTDKTTRRTTSAKHYIRSTQQQSRFSEESSSEASNEADLAYEHEPDSSFERVQEVQDWTAENEEGYAEAAGQHGEDEGLEVEDAQTEEKIGSFQFPMKLYIVL